MTTQLLEGLLAWLNSGELLLHHTEKNSLLRFRPTYCQVNSQSRWHSS